MTITSCCSGPRPWPRGAAPLRSGSEALLGSLPATRLASGTGTARHRDAAVSNDWLGKKY